MTKNRLKGLFFLIFSASLTGSTFAAPYIVYSGTSVNTSYSAAGPVRVSTPLYLITDVSNPSSYSLLELNSSSKTYTILSRPSATPTTGENDTNFLGSIEAANGRSGICVFNFDDETVQNNGDTVVTRAYATGPLDMSDLPLATARTKPLAVNLRANGKSTGTYTFTATTPAISTGDNHMPKNLSGTWFSYEIGADRALVATSVPGAFSLGQNATFSLEENTVLTSLVNIGGAYTQGNNTLAFLPLTVPSGTTASLAYTSWLATLAQANGFSIPNVGAGVTGGSFGAGLEINSGGSLVLNGGNTYFGGMSLISGDACTLLGANNTGTAIVANGGNLTFNGANLSSVSTIGFSNNSTSGVLTLGAGTVETTNADGSVSSILTGNPNLTITGGSIGLGDTAFNPHLGTTGTLFSNDATLTVSALHNSLVDGTITLSGNAGRLTSPMPP